MKIELHFKNNHYLSHPGIPGVNLCFKSPRYTGGDFMFLYRAARAAAGRRLLSTR